MFNQQTKLSFFALVKGSWESTAGERPRLFLFIFLFILAYTFDLLVPWTVGYTLGVFVQHGSSEEAFRLATLGILAYTALRLAHTFFHHIARYVQNRVAYHSRMNMLSNIFGKLLSFPLRWHLTHHSGETLSKLHRSADSVNQVVGTFIWQIIEGTVKVVFAGIALFALDIWVAINVLTMCGATIFIMILFNTKLAVRIRNNNLFANKLNRICVDYLANIITVKMLSVEEPARQQLKSQRDEGRILSQKVAKYMELMWGTTGVGYGLVIGSSLLIYFYTHRTVDNALDVAQVYVILNYLDRIFQAIGSFTGYYSGIIQASTSYEDAVEIIEQSKKHQERHALSSLDRTWSNVSIKGLNFSYITADKVGLIDVACEFKRGEKIALVGPSGSGKSTLLKVLAGLIEPDSYAISTNIQPSVNLDDFTKTCLLVPQEPEVFSANVSYNLTMGQEFDPKEISFYVSLCKFDLILAKLPKGWETDLEEKGHNLSVGEKQRLALARGLLRASGKDILLLDEPTSSLDPKTEKEVYLGLLYHFNERTVFSSCHRLHLIPLFDRIIFMAQSSVQEVGTFEELLEKKGHFFRAWEDYERNIHKSTSSHAIPVPPH